MNIASVPSILAPLSLLKNQIGFGIGSPVKIAVKNCLSAEWKIGRGCDALCMSCDCRCIRAMQLTKGNGRPLKQV
jgi:hypothetical protein